MRQRKRKGVEFHTKGGGGGVGSGDETRSNAYRARVPAHCIVRANQMHGIKSHDYAGMKGMQIT